MATKNRDFPWWDGTYDATDPYQGRSDLVTPFADQTKQDSQDTARITQRSANFRWWVSFVLLLGIGVFILHKMR